MSFGALMDPERFLRDLFQVAIESVHPNQLMDIDLPEPPTGRTIVVGAGKAAASMAVAFEDRWSGAIEGLVVTRYGHSCPTRHIEVVEASHPVPDTKGIEAAKRIMEMVRWAGQDDLVIVLISGGASALLTAPITGISLGQKQDINRALLKSGAPITEMNCVRRHLSSIKGGKLAQLIEPARSLTLLISDVAGDDPSTIGSGPTIADQTTPNDALAILDQYGIQVGAAVRYVLENTSNMVMLNASKHEIRILGTAQKMLQSAAQYAAKAGVHPVILGDDFEIDARDLAHVHASIVCQIEKGHGLAQLPCVLLSGGEASVAVTGAGRGGRNSQFLLALALALEGKAECWAIACDSDGIDGTESNAGGIIGPASLDTLGGLGVSAQSLLANTDSYRFLEFVDGVVTTGPTRTNVNDFRAIMVGFSC